MRLQRIFCKFPAKTGEKVYRGIFNIPLNHLDAGQYLLTYWKSENNGVTWEREMTQITVSSTSKSYLIGSTSSYVDEVRVHPARALMTTATYKLGYGKHPKQMRMVILFITSTMDLGG